MERKVFLQKVYDFAKVALKQSGTTTLMEVHHSNTQVECFVEVGNFRIDSNTGQNMYGSSDMTIKKKDSGKVLLHLGFYGSFDAYDESLQMGSEVRTFETDLGWQKSMIELIDNFNTQIGGKDK